MFRRRQIPTDTQTRAAALAIVAARNEVHALEALNRHDDAQLLRAWADEQQRATFKVRPLIWRGRTGLEDLSPGVRQVVSSYANGEDRAMPGGAG